MIRSKNIFCSRPSFFSVSSDTLSSLSSSAGCLLGSSPNKHSIVEFNVPLDQKIKSITFLGPADLGLLSLSSPLKAPGYLGEGCQASLQTYDASTEYYDLMIIIIISNYQHQNQTALKRIPPVNFNMLSIKEEDG